MEYVFYEIDGTEELDYPNKLELSRSKLLVEAICRERNFSIIKLLRKIDAAKKQEYVIVDIECDGIPHKNSLGILYRERLGFCISEDPKKLIEVLALRKDFPRFFHQNQVAPNSAASLCLYYEPPSSVLRTWTPQKFLKRVQWWLEASSRRELHAADQPVEQLFFVSPYELVLPWNYDELRKDNYQNFSIFHRGERPDRSITFFLSKEEEDSHKKQFSTLPIEFTLHPMLQGQVSSFPTTLGELSDYLGSYSSELITALRKLIQSRINAEGVSAVSDSDDTSTIILLHIPICRERNSPPEKIAHCAFFMPFDALKLGVDLNALFTFDNKYFRSNGLLNMEENTNWRSQPVFPMEVLRCNDAKLARDQSGLTNIGQNSVLIGAGSLGSAMLNLWGRSGWGQWTIIDNDHIKPHNISRHVAYGSQIGITKIDAAIELHEAVMLGASKVIGLFADACDISQEKVWQTLREAKIIVDASTTLEYPRLVSTKEDVGRQFSAFITPDGNSAVLLAEDSERLIRLRTLEAQYYRALINQDWGASHLNENLGTFWSGASCRDISTVMPYSRIVGHAATLAEQIQLTASNADAVIRIWSRNPSTGAVIIHDVDIVSERRIQFDKLNVFVDMGVEEKLRSMKLMHSPCETGGILLGYYDFNVNSIVIVDALPAPADSISSLNSFERGVDKLTEIVTEISRRTAGIVGYLGEWHSHPPGHSAHPSRDDIQQLTYLAREMSNEGLLALSLIVGENDIQILQGTFENGKL